MEDRRPDGSRVGGSGRLISVWACDWRRGITSQGGSLYVVDSGTPDELWRIDDPTAPGSAVLEGSFPSGLATPTGITSQGGSLYVVDSGHAR